MSQWPDYRGHLQRTAVDCLVDIRNYTPASSSSSLATAAAAAAAVTSSRVSDVTGGARQGGRPAHGGGDGGDRRPPPPPSLKKYFRCPHCRYSTDRKNNLKRHLGTMHRDQYGPAALDAVRNYHHHQHLNVNSRASCQSCVEDCAFNRRSCIIVIIIIISSGQIVKSEQGERFPLPSPFPLPPLSFFLTPSFPFLSPSLPLPSLPLEVGPLNPDRVWGSAVSSVSGVWGGGEPQPKSNSVHLPFWP